MRKPRAQPDVVDVVDGEPGREGPAPASGRSARQAIAEGGEFVEAEAPAGRVEVAEDEVEGPARRIGLLAGRRDRLAGTGRRDRVGELMPSTTRSRSRRPSTSATTLIPVPPGSVRRALHVSGHREQTDRRYQYGLVGSCWMPTNEAPGPRSVTSPSIQLSGGASLSTIRSGFPAASPALGFPRVRPSEEPAAPLDIPVKTEISRSPGRRSSTIPRADHRASRPRDGREPQRREAESEARR